MKYAFPSEYERSMQVTEPTTSVRFHAIIKAALGERVILGTPVVYLDENEIRLSDGRTMRARCVIDARGARASPHLMLGFQKFLGLEVRLEKPHGQAVPIIMDATVPQNDGYRFVYTLPFSADTLLIEDTYYSDGKALAPQALKDHIFAYAQMRGWRILEVLREESGVLPIILAGDIAQYVNSNQSGVPQIGLGAGLFHPTTGYSLPDAVRMADSLANAGPLNTAFARALIHSIIRKTWSERSIFRLLNRMLFKAGQPERRYEILQRFYGLQPNLIRQFYAARLTSYHKARLLIGKPPVPIRGRAALGI